MPRPRLHLDVKSRLAASERAFRAAGGRRKHFRLSADAVAALGRLMTQEGAPRTELELVEALLISAASGWHPVGKGKRDKLIADGYQVNGVAMMHPGTGQRALVDYWGAVHWIKRER